jgi:hypothetical protein
MKRIATVISVMVASMLFSAITLLGAEKYTTPFGSYGKDLQSNQKNECLLVAKNCASESITIRQRLIDIRREISKGLRVYSEKELQILREQLRWLEYEGHEII